MTLLGVMENSPADVMVRRSAGTSTRQRCYFPAETQTGMKQLFAPPVARQHALSIA